MTVNRISEASAKYLVDSSTSNVPAGYKKTEVGIIPEDWGFKQVQEICDFIVPGRNKPRSFDGHIPWITTPDLQGRILVNSSKMGLKISQAEAKFIGSKIVPAGSVIMSCVGELGIVAIAETEIVINQQLHAFLPSKDINNYFLACLLLSLEKYFYSVATKTTLPYLNKDRCNSTPIFIPSMEEQAAIANALSDVDALIQELEKLIAKKQAIKTATMQQLLTGRTRLPPFGFEKSAHHPNGRKKGYKPSELGEIPEDWEIYPLSSICDVRDGTHDSPKYKGNGIPLVTSKNIVNDVLDMTDVSLISFEDAFEINKRSKVDKGDVIMSMIGSVGSAVLLRQAPEFCIKNVALFKPRNVLGEFLVQLIRSKVFQDYLANSMDGGIQKFVSLGTLRSMEIALPTKEEQSTLATILCDMDEEIQTLDQRLNKTRQIKQGMMQELLTGKTRLVKPAEPA
ncbi:restriction endonuclease subunit S [Shewanella sp. GD04112]|uniref:restriction endonuclease subunit S n=1 Tax=Shewanella sp. GD04112 TaxID=2975434 RepID=UPI00244BA83E|nr:restriction endonuclease subunit S [Shewanella sp. GD04112]MDH0450359.1 restriction endonuclease subunit S [Shewanella sp. GD04112]